MKQLLLACLAVCALAEEVTWYDGAPCKLQHSLQPSEDFGQSQSLDNPPFDFSITDSNGYVVGFYKPGDVYKSNLQLSLAKKMPFLLFASLAPQITVDNEFQFACLVKRISERF